jgi:signal peptidase II
MPLPGRAIAALLCTLALTYAADQLSKSWAVARLWLSPPVEVIPGLLELRLHFNDGAAFGIASGRGAWLLVLPALVAIAIVVWLLRVRPTLPVWAIAGAVVGGVLGNASDRVLREVPGFGSTRRAVVDFIAMLPGRWPAFNVADLAIVAGGVLLLLAHARASRRDAARVGVVAEP